VARGGLDEVPLFRRNGNVARCDITENVGGGVRLCHTHYGFRMSLSLGTSTSQLARLSASGDPDPVMGWALLVEDCLSFEGI